MKEIKAIDRVGNGYEVRVTGNFKNTLYFVKKIDKRSFNWNTKNWTIQPSCEEEGRIMNMLLNQKDIEIV